MIARSLSVIQELGANIVMADTYAPTVIRLQLSGVNKLWKARFVALVERMYPMLESLIVPVNVKDAATQNDKGRPKLPFWVEVTKNNLGNISIDSMQGTISQRYVLCWLSIWMRLAVHAVSSGDPRTAGLASNRESISSAPHSEEELDRWFVKEGMLVSSECLKIFSSY